MSATQHNLKDCEQVAIFRKLLSEHSALISSTPASSGSLDIKRFLDEYENEYKKASKAETIEAKTTLGVFELFFPDYREAQEQRRKGQIDKADDFNILDVMGLTGKENTHSDILAWLLDHDIDRLGTHAQGNLGFRLFLEAVGLTGEIGKYLDRDFRVTRESPADESRIDIEVAHLGSFVIHIENKIWAAEGEDQTNREWRDLERRAKELYCQKNYYAFFLTPRGVKPKNDRFKPISWQKIAGVFEKFAAEIQSRTAANGALAVSLFATHYAEVLRRYFALENNDREETNAQESI